MQINNKKVFDLIDKALKTIKAPKGIIETNERVFEPTPAHFKKWTKFGGILFVSGMIIKISAAIFPATMPIGLISLAPELITTGLTMAGISIQTSKYR